MTNRFVEHAKSQYGAIEKLLSGLPGIGGYMDKELRRDADYKLRQMIAENLSDPLKELLSVQKKLLKGGGLSLLDETNTCVTRLQTLIDRIKSASYGYTGLFDAVKVREEQLDALHRFDVALASAVSAGRCGCPGRRSGWQGSQRESGNHHRTTDRPDRRSDRSL